MINLAELPSVVIQVILISYSISLGSLHDLLTVTGISLTSSARISFNLPTSIIVFFCTKPIILFSDNSAFSSSLMLMLLLVSLSALLLIISISSALVVYPSIFLVVMGFPPHSTLLSGTVHTRMEVHRMDSEMSRLVERPWLQLMCCAVCLLRGRSFR